MLKAGSVDLVDAGVDLNSIEFEGYGVVRNFFLRSTEKSRSVHNELDPTARQAADSSELFVKNIKKAASLRPKVNPSFIKGTMV